MFDEEDNIHAHNKINPVATAQGTVTTARRVLLWLVIPRLL